jgi:hypothetical protein
VEPENRQERFVHSPHLFWREVAHKGTKTTAIDGTDLFDKHLGGLASHLCLWSE